MRYFLVFLLVSCSSGPIEIDKQKKKHRPAEIKELEPQIAEKFKVKGNTVDPDKTKAELARLAEEEGNAVKEKKVSKKSHKVKLVKAKKVKITKPKKKLTKEDEDAKKLWENFSTDFLHMEEESLISATYLGINAATLKVKVLGKALVDKSEVYRFYARAQSASFYSWVYELDDVVESYVRTSDFLPLKYSISQRETKKTVDHLEFYDRDKKMTYFRYKKIKDGEESYKKEDKPMPYFSQDFLSCFFFVRGLPLKKGDTYLIPITTKGKTWTMKTEVLKKEKIRLSQSGYRNAIKLRVVTKYDGDLAKQGTMYIWLSNDEYRKILKFKSELKIGAVTGELISFKIGGKELL